MSSVNAIQSFTSNLKTEKPSKPNRQPFMGIFESATTENGNKYVKTHLEERTLFAAGAIAPLYVIGKTSFAKALNEAKDFFKNVKTDDAKLVAKIFKGAGKIGVVAFAALTALFGSFVLARSGKIAGRALDEDLNQQRAKTADIIASSRKS